MLRPHPKPHNLLPAMMSNKVVPSGDHNETPGQRTFDIEANNITPAQVIVQNGSSFHIPRQYHWFPSWYPPSLVLPTEQLRNEYKVFESEDAYPLQNIYFLIIFHVLIIILCFWESLFFQITPDSIHIITACLFIVPILLSIALLRYQIKRLALLHQQALQDDQNDEEESCVSGNPRFNLNESYMDLYKTIGFKPDGEDYIRIFEIGVILSSCLCIGINLIASAATVTCTNNNNMRICENPIDRRPIANVYFTLLSPVLVSTMFRGIRWEMSSLAQVLVSIMSITAVIISRDVSVIPNLILGTIFGLAFSYEIRRRGIYRFLMIRDQRDMLSTQLRQLFEKGNELNLADARTEGMKYSIANITHDLKTPLQSFQITLDELKDTMKELHSIASLSHWQGGSDEKFIASLDMLNHLTNSCTIMFMTINRSLDFTKVSSGIMLVPNIETVHLQDALDMPILCMRCLQDRIPIQILPFHDICTMILTDKTWFQENILCLVSNAVKYSGDGEITVTLKLVSIDGEGSSKKIHLCVEIEDCGIGLSDEAKSKLFQPFNQAQRAAGGTGLGLFSLLQRMIALNGSCGVKNREDGQQGSVFWFQFPYKPDDAAAKDLEQMKSMKVGGVSDNSVMRVVNPLDASMSGTGESGLRSLRVLLVDDSLVILRVIQKALLRAGHVVDSAENGALGLKALESAVTPYDVVISDIQMPVMDGYEFCRRVRLGEDMQSDLNESSSRRQLMIGMSANTAGDAQRDAVAAGLDAFIGKPFNINDVTQLLLKYPSFRVHDRAFEAGLLQDLGLFEHSEGFWANGLG